MVDYQKNVRARPVTRKKNKGRDSNRSYSSWKGF